MDSRMMFLARSMFLANCLFWCCFWVFGGFALGTLEYSDRLTPVAFRSLRLNCIKLLFWLTIVFV